MMKSILIGILFLFSQVMIAQDSLSLKIDFTHFDQDSMEYSTQFSSIGLLKKEIQNVVHQLEKKSYLEANWVDLKNNKNKYFATVHIGPSYHWLKINNHNIPLIWLEKLQIDLSQLKNQPIQAEKWMDLKNKILDFAQNNGYPFAQIKLDSIDSQKQGLSGNLFLKKNQSFSFGKIVIHGDAGISPNYLSQYLDIHTNDLYQQKKIDDIPKRLKNLPFITVVQSSKLQFIGDKADIHLYLKRKPLNKFDIIFGVAPNNNIFDPRKIIFTGQGSMDLFNSFKHGERFQVAFEYLEKSTQSIELNGSYPYLFQLPFGANVGFGLFKKDTSYLDVNYHFGLSYQISKYQSLQVFFDNKTSNLLNINKELVLQTQQLPSVLDIARSSFGIQYNFQALDYRFNPRKGWDIQLKGSFGKKIIEKNRLITDLKIDDNPSFKFDSLYNVLNLNQNQYQFSTTISYFIPLLKRSVILTKIASESIFGDGKLFDNEFIRLGGATRIRGFNEDQFLASFFTAFTLEYRWILQKNAHFFLFSDIAYLESNQKEGKIINKPLGLGTGIRFETKAGIFGLSAAIGRDFSNEMSFFDFRSPKIHFGFLSLF